MSAYMETETVMTEGVHLLAALAELGFPQPQVFTQSVPLIGYHGDERQQRAHIIIPRAQIGSASNDVGFLKRADGRYEAIISDFDRHRFNAAWLGKLAQHYAVHRTMAVAKTKGYAYQGRTEVDGKVQLRFQVRA